MGRRINTLKYSILGSGFRIYIPAAPTACLPLARATVDVNNAIPLTTVINEPSTPRFVCQSCCGAGAFRQYINCEKRRKQEDSLITLFVWFRSWA